MKNGYLEIKYIQNKVVDIGYYFDTVDGVILKTQNRDTIVFLSDFLKFEEGNVLEVRKREIVDNVSSIKLMLTICIAENQFPNCDEMAKLIKIPVREIFQDFEYIRLKRFMTLSNIEPTFSDSQIVEVLKSSFDVKGNEYLLSKSARVKAFTITMRRNKTLELSTEDFNLQVLKSPVNNSYRINLLSFLFVGEGIDYNFETSKLLIILNEYGIKSKKGDYIGIGKSNDYDKTMSTAFCACCYKFFSFQGDRLITPDKQKLRKACKSIENYLYSKIIVTINDWNPDLAAIYLILNEIRRTK